MHFMFWTTELAFILNQRPSWKGSLANAPISDAQMCKSRQKRAAEAQP